MGFQHMKEPIQRAASRKGGKIRADNKGFAANPELAKQAGAKGGKAKYANKGRNKAFRETHSDSTERIRLADVFGDLDETKL